MAAQNKNLPIIIGVNGPVVTVSNPRLLSMSEMVYVGNSRFVGEVIYLNEEKASIQVFEDTSGLRTGEPVFPSGSRLSVTLGPGIIGGIFDGIQNPLNVMEHEQGAFISRGTDFFPLNTKVEWDITVFAKEGQLLSSGDIYAECPETGTIVHKLIVPPNISGVVKKVSPNGKYNIKDKIIELETADGKSIDLGLFSRWPVRTPRPVKKRISQGEPLFTGQRVIDTFFPIAKGGAAAIPGGFGTGKTMTQHQLAKWCNADIIIYIGCGERGNEMTQALTEFSALIDPRTNRSLMERTVLIANTSNMPVAAREASIYTGITIAEYYRDMGYDTAVMADSTSRWAEALREISGRMEEMPADEGFPAYLPSRLASFYERSGAVETLCRKNGSISVIGAVSPQGSDFSEPVTQNTKRFTRCFWALDKSLAYARHYPSINWTESYSEYSSELKNWYSENAGSDFYTLRSQMMNILIEEARLMEIVRLISSDVLADEQKLILQTAQVIKTGYLQQNAMHETDTYVPLKKQYLMMKAIISLHTKCRYMIARQETIASIIKTGVFDRIIKMKYDISNDNPQEILKIIADIEDGSYFKNSTEVI
ncbi:V-type ATP synthase subunit A [Eubacteriales bacterium OttesenSCG-928-G02]|nr:V-type ATP synthase subunit A [Eubacteriales bacterium OttesenSCG-928-G02]